MQTSLHFERRVHWLGYTGLIPLLLGSAWLTAQPTSELALDLVTNYAAVILTFVGAIHWGRGLIKQHPGLVTLSVIPSLLAFACLMLPARDSLPLLAAGFLAMLMLDSHQYRMHPYFRTLRIRLSTIFILCLISVWIMSS